MCNEVGLSTLLVRSQLLRYAVVGLTSNALLYLSYLALTRVGIEPKLAMTLVFAAGVTYTFFLNKRWTFAHGGSVSRTYARYWVAYGAAYGLNLGLLALFVDRVGYAHEVVQGALILGNAALLFLLQKFWVFREAAPSAAAGQC